MTITTEVGNDPSYQTYLEISLLAGIDRDRVIAEATLFVNVHIRVSANVWRYLHHLFLEEVLSLVLELEPLSLVN